MANAQDFVIDLLFVKGLRMTIKEMAECSNGDRKVQSIRNGISRLRLKGFKIISEGKSVFVFSGVDVPEGFDTSGTVYGFKRREESDVLNKKENFLKVNLPIHELYFEKHQVLLGRF